MYYGYTAYEVKMSQKSFGCSYYQSFEQICRVYCKASIDVVKWTVLVRIHSSLSANDPLSNFIM